MKKRFLLVLAASLLISACSDGQNNQKGYSVSSEKYYQLNFVNIWDNDDSYIMINDTSSYLQFINGRFHYYNNPSLTERLVNYSDSVIFISNLYNETTWGYGGTTNTTTALDNAIENGTDITYKAFGEIKENGNMISQYGNNGVGVVSYERMYITESYAKSHGILIRTE